MCGRGNNVNGGRSRSGGRGRGRTNQGQGGRGRRGRSQSGRSDRGNNHGRGGQQTNENQRGRGGGRGRGRGRGRGDRGSWHGGWKPVAMTVSMSTTSSEAEASSASTKKNSNTKITTLPWPDPTTHYIEIEDEEQMLPVLVHWGKSERGMMKDQPPFRLQKIQDMLSNIQLQRTQSQSQSTTHHISLIQSLSFRRHQLKFLNPTYDMTSLRLGNMDIIKKSATKFEDCVETYLRSHKVPFLTEWEQKRKTRAAGMLDPPSPDFMLKDGHSVKLSLVVSSAGNENTANESVNSEQSQSSSAADHPLVINWIEAKMFYGASSIPSGTPNAVGCVIPKMQQYVSLYGTGAIVFMYGCGSQLAQQLLEVGVVALDGRCLDLERVEKHQKKWCADACGNILF